MIQINGNTGGTSGTGIARASSGIDTPAPAGNAFESMLAAASQVKTEPSQAKAPAQQAEHRPDRQAAPAEKAASPDSDSSASARTAVKDPSRPATGDADADPAGSTATADPATEKPSDKPDDEMPAAGLPIAPDLSILAQIMAGLGKPLAKSAHVTARADVGTDAVSGDTVSTRAGTARRTIDLPVEARSKSAVGSAAAGADALAKAAEPSDLAATAIGARTAGFDAALSAKAAMGATEAGAALPTKLAADAPAAIPTAGSIDISSLTGATSASTVAVATAASRIESQVGTSAWGAEVVDQVKQFTMQKIDVAELTMNPAELGPVKVEIAYDKGTAAIHFSAERAETRAALESNFAQLRSSLADSGVDLGNASTGQFSEGRAFEFMQQGRERRSGEGNARGGRGSASVEASVTGLAASAAPRTTRQVDGNVDLFA
ncbi:flagellar hook-length control protein FliK [soil metagenome]